MDERACDPSEGSGAERGLGHWLLLAGVLLGLVFVVGSGRLLEADERGFGTHEQLGMQPCVTMDRWGIPCPGCGVTTSVVLASQGRLGASLRVQPLGVFLIALTLVGLVWAVRKHVRGEDAFSELGRIPLLPASVVLGVVVTGAWIYKLATVLSA